MSTKLPLYRMLDAPLRGGSGSVVNYRFLSRGDLEPGATMVSDNQYAMGKDSDWSPAEHPLVVQCQIDQAPLLEVVFGPHGVASPKSEVLLALEWMSADSCWRMLGPAHALRYEVEDSHVMLSIEMGPGTIRGSGLLSVQAFLGRQTPEVIPGFAYQAGARLGPVSSPIEVIVDGDGSLFPVLEEPLGSDGPLWQLRSCWSDPRDEPFSSDYVALVLNNEHAHFGQLRDRRALNIEQSPLMRQVFAAWLALLINEVKEDMGAQFERFIATPYGEEGVASIAEAVSSFIRLGGLNISSLPELFISTQCWLDRRVRELESEA